MLRHQTRGRGSRKGGYIVLAASEVGCYRLLPFLARGMHVRDGWQSLQMNVTRRYRTSILLQLSGHKSQCNVCDFCLHHSRPLNSKCSVKDHTCGQPTQSKSNNSRLQFSLFFFFTFFLNTVIITCFKISFAKSRWQAICSATSSW